MAPRPGRIEAAYITGIEWSDLTAMSCDASDSASSAAIQRIAARTRRTWPRLLKCPYSNAARATSTKLIACSGPARLLWPSAFSLS